MKAQSHTCLSLHPSVPTSVTVTVQQMLQPQSDLFCLTVLKLSSSSSTLSRAAVLVSASSSSVPTSNTLSRRVASSSEFDDLAACWSE
ncbi:hypothetical protein INR49_010111 [Caranx melampygus]|nr:hypothetical protein INR49_010111 [Caranx melampygus]